MAIGLEIEVNIPIDQLSAVDVGAIAATHALAAPTLGQKMTAKGRRDQNGAVAYGPIVPPANGFRVDADHDDRVTSPGWPLHEGSRDAIIEIVMFPPANNRAALDVTFGHIRTYIQNVWQNTDSMRGHWVGAIAAAAPYPAINMGPLDTSMGNQRRRDPKHGLKGSIQVNVGIDLREYHSMLKWYAESKYSKPTKAIPAARPIYTQIRVDLLRAIAVGKAETINILGGLTNIEKAACGNCRGLRGFFTHLAQYMIRGMAGGVPGTVKNLAPALLKSPNTILAQYGLTVAEQALYTGDREAIVRRLLAACGRAIPALTALNTVEVFLLHPGNGFIDDFSDLASANVLLTGGAILAPTGVGVLRGGSPAMLAMTPVPVAPANFGITGVNSRGGVVIEYRTLPGFYDGVNRWRSLGRDFMTAATTRNGRAGNTLTD